jgi:hypothetical protein
VFDLVLTWPGTKFYGLPDDSMEICIRDGGLNLDIFVCYQDGDTIRHAVFGNFNDHSYEKFYYSYAWCGVKPFKFLGRDCYVPIHTERYLEENYGQDWMTEKTAWNYLTSPPHCGASNVSISKSESYKSLRLWLQLPVL